jgi:2-polyprenyl-6-methoxyphenol hydroxylase-like FAD-dependent oxidoreductase
MPHFIIIGAGIAGPVAALRLLRTSTFGEANIITIFERAPKPHTIGGAVNLAPNGMRLLHRLGVGKEIEERGCRVESLEMRGDKGEVLGYFHNSSRDGFVSVRIMRSVLQEILLKACKERGVVVKFGKELVDVEEEEGKVRASFKDGTSVEGDFLIGADGIHSKTREYVLGEDIKPVHKGQAIVYGILPTANLPNVDFSSLHPTFGIFARKGFFAAAFTHNDRSQLYWLSVKTSSPG